jgi:hypothetical protein
VENIHFTTADDEHEEEVDIHSTTGWQSWGRGTQPLNYSRWQVRGRGRHPLNYSRWQAEARGSLPRVRNKSWGRGRQLFNWQ